MIRAVKVRRLARLRLVLVALVALALLAGAWVWLRDSSLVAVSRVTVLGDSGPDAAQIRGALSDAARDMSTLDVRMDQLRTAVTPYSVVAGLSVSTQFPHGMTIRVIERYPVASVLVDGSKEAVAGDGTLLRDQAPSSALPVVPLASAPAGPRLSGEALAEVEVLAAAPRQLLSRVSQVSIASDYGLVARVRAGPSIYFGQATQLAGKWTAAAEVLADAGSAGADYIDVSDPQRPAAGAGPDGGALGGG
ncbi:MAG: FtsQ-type POTRA domain-containing protein [Solirubrobacterales bacterium]|nr:FtsQ-type POTRA domain-containing protein [Solirubrobacterales bacterium]